jgi:2-haloalkanoic acid dehalogenase type II
MSIASPKLFTFDIFGTVLDWRTGLSHAVGRELDRREFDAVIDRQGELEGKFAPYTQIVAQSLVDVLKVNSVLAAGIATGAGRWPLFPDSREAMQRLRKIAPCVATTNSDVAHGEDVQAQLAGMDGWVCAEAIRVYKPDRKVWQETARTLGRAFGPDWWHVSAYADYDLEVARQLGLTSVFIERPHSRPGKADLKFQTLAQLADYVEAL